MTNLAPTEGAVLAVRVIGAGLGRTGTTSLKAALERVVGEPCYHMNELWDRPDDLPIWRQASRGESADWRSLLSGYGAVVDWPAASYWPELAAAFPDAVVLLSVRATPEQWWTSASTTIFPVLTDNRVDEDPWIRQWSEMMDRTMRDRFTMRLDDRECAIAAYEKHNAMVRAQVDPERLVVWQPGDGWAPLCRALDLPEPDAPFPHENTTAEFLADDKN
jgi:hypothetical protein